jgi:hypothetical protein
MIDNNYFYFNLYFHKVIPNLAYLLVKGKFSIHKLKINQSVSMINSEKKMSNWFIMLVAKIISIDKWTYGDSSNTLYHKDRHFR